MRVKRNINGMEVRGCKPITVYFEKWQDKDDILRKSNMLRGHNIFIGEDFSKRVRDQVIIIVLLFIFVNQSIGSNFTMKIYFFKRQELRKFQKLMRQRRPQSKFSLQYDKLIVDNEIYMFNDMTGKVEEVCCI